MGYKKEIVIHKSSNFNDFSALELINILESNGWQRTLDIINIGNDFDWIEAKDKSEFEEILKHKTIKNEWIGFSLENIENERIIQVDLNDKIIFTLDVGRDEDEIKCFKWYHEQLVPPLENVISSVEWRTGYDNHVIKTFNQ